jgi:hypothetical protein
MRNLECKLLTLTVILIFFKTAGIGQITHVWQPQPNPLHTKWSKNVSSKNPLSEYPRPKMIRNKWQNLNGLWEYAIIDSSLSKPSHYQGNILVPFPVESSLSGVKRALLPNEYLYYKRYIKKPITKKGDLIILNFGGIDWRSTIYINGNQVAEHSGGYTAFSVNITNHLISGENEIVIKVFDPTDQGVNPHGKQTLEPANIYYTASSGIWQTVWLEIVPNIYIERINMVPDIDNQVLSCDVICNVRDTAIKVQIVAKKNGKTISKLIGSNSDKLVLSVPHAKLWSPEDPYLYDLTVKLIKNGKVLDHVSSYFGMRKVDIKPDKDGISRINLNNKPYYNLGVLDQGFWPDGLYTAPTEDALKFDLDCIKKMGFNTIRKHIKVEPARWYYHADKIGMLVWQDFINPPHSLPEGCKTEFEHEIKDIIDQLRNYNCITTWVIFNERWGAYDQARLTSWVKWYDSSRLVNGHSGELLYVNGKLRALAKTPYINSDITDVHSYPSPMMPLQLPGKAMVCGEFGGIGLSVPNHQWTDLHGWGYIQVTPKEYEKKYKQLIDSLLILKQKGLSGSIYTEPFDVEGEENGFLTYDRRVIKIPINRLREINGRLIKLEATAVVLNRKDSPLEIDINDTDDRYSEFYDEYVNGKLDSSFLRRLLLMALRKDYVIVAKKINTDYIKQLKLPLKRDNLEFMSFTTRSTSDTGFQILLKHRAAINEAMGENYAEKKIKSIIKKEHLEPLLKDAKSVDWQEVIDIERAKFGDLGEELAIGFAMMDCLDKKEWINFGKYYSLYFKLALIRSDYHINNLSYYIFLYSDDKNVINSAINAMEFSLNRFDRYDYGAYDTYANLLYKLGRITEAIQWEEKAKNGDPNDKEIEANYKMMIENKPTWNK